MLGLPPQLNFITGSYHQRNPCAVTSLPVIALQAAAGLAHITPALPTGHLPPPHGTPQTQTQRSHTVTRAQQVRVLELGLGQSGGGGCLGAQVGGCGCDCSCGLDCGYGCSCDHGCSSCDLYCSSCDPCCRCDLGVVVDPPLDQSQRKKWRVSGQRDERPDALPAVHDALLGGCDVLACALLLAAPRQLLPVVAELLRRALPSWGCTRELVLPWQPCAVTEGDRGGGVNA